MAMWRLIKNSVRFAFRAKKRWITFVVIFAFLSAFITFFAGTFNQYATDDLLEQKGFYIKAQNTEIIKVNESQAEALVDQIEDLPGIESVAMFRFFDLGDYIRVFGVDPGSSWMFKSAKPSLIRSGRYIIERSDVVISTGSTIKADLGTFSSNVSATLHIGEQINFVNAAETTFELNVVGEINDTVNAPDKLRMFISDEDFDYLHDNFADTTPVYCESISVLVIGNLYNPFSEEIFENMIRYDEPSEPLFTLVNEGSYGSWVPPDTVAESVKKQRATDFLIFIFGIAGGILLTILYNFLIVWFRRREVAVLRAMGYEKGEIRINLLGESLTISFVGYLIGILAIIIYFWIQQMAFSNYLLTWTTLLISFVIVVVLTIPGLLLSSLSFVRVSPVILFKAR
ncbi:MAG: ABC transporter permease [Candidatus Heimdallarchaeota archaeon]|nr:ABC transporter permease [Candidatus Heimdallarchaeota archaeon]